MRRKGDLKIEPTFRILLFVFVLLILVLFVTGLFEYLSKLLGFGLQPPPSAAAAVLALRCAIDSVAYGAVNDYTCLKDVDIPPKVVYTPVNNYDDAISYIRGEMEIRQTLFSRMWYSFEMFFSNGKESEHIGYAFGYANPKTGFQNITVTVCGNKKMLEKESQEVKDFFKYLAESDEFKCMVFNFELPQYNKPIGVGNALVPNLGDPDFIIYYEKFPSGEERAWLDDTDSWGTVGVLVAGAFAAIPYAGPIIRTAMRDTASAAFKMVKSSLLFWKSAVREGTVTGVRDALMYEVRNYGKTLTREEAEDVAKLIMKGKMDDAAEKLVEKGMSREAAEDVVNEWRWLRGLKDEEVALAFKFERQFADYLMDTSGRYFGLESRTFKDFLTAWKSLPDETADQAVYKAKLFGKLVKGDPVVINGRRYQLTPEEVQQIRKFVQEQNKKLLGTYYKYYKRLPRNVRRMYYGREVDRVIAEYLKNSRSFRLMMIEGLGYAGLFDDLSMGKVDVDGDGHPDDVFFENVMKCVTVMPNKGTAPIIGKGICIVLSGIGWAITWAEARTYYEPVGVNSIGLYYPIIKFIWGRSLEYPLIKEALPYYVYLDRPFDPPRLYFASPCKAVLYVEKSKMECLVPNCEALEKYHSEYLYDSDFFPYETDYYGCRDEKGKCVVPKDPKAAGDQGYCYCIRESINPCYDAFKCDKWIEEYVGCHKVKEGMYTPFALYNVNVNGVSSKFLVGGVDYHKVKELDNNVRGYKVCTPPAWWDIEIPWLGRHLFSEPYTVNAIKVTAALADVEPNYCYWGKGDVSYAIEKVSLASLFFGIDLAIGETPLVILSAMGYAYLDEQIDEKYRWWNHPDSLIPDWVVGFVPPLALLKAAGM